MLDVQKSNMTESVMGPRIALAAIILMLLQPKIALSGRWRNRFNANVEKRISFPEAIQPVETKTLAICLLISTLYSTVVSNKKKKCQVY